MPKMKTNRGAAKRFRRTGTGAIKCRRAFRNHILTKKSQSQKRRLRATSRLHKNDVPAVDRLLD